jgi:PRTRC genetic system protein A
MFKIVLNDGETPLPDDPIYYIIAKDGVYLKKSLGIMDSIAPVKNISILKDIQSSARMNITKMPGKWFAKTKAFFAEVYKEYRSEAIVLLFYNEQTGQHKIIPPTQKVAGATCDYDKGITLEGYTMIGTIHSHGSMSAFHSGVDDHDEEHFDGLHITLGNLNDEYPSVSASIVANGFRSIIDPSDYIEDLVLMEETNEVDKKSMKTVYKWVDGERVIDSVTQAPTFYSYYGKTRFDRRYDVAIPERDKIFNKKWMKMVSRGVYTFKSYKTGTGNWAQGFYGHGAHAFSGKWGQHFDSALWAQSGRNLPALITDGKTPSALQSKTPPITFPPHTVDGEFIPCATCAHRMCKLIDEMNEEEYDDIYQCEQCGQVVYDEEGTILQCLNCLTDEHLILVDDTKLKNNYIFEDAQFVEESEEEVISSYINCLGCGSRFHIDGPDSYCPFCQTPVNFSKEEELIDQSRSDTGDLLDAEVNEANEAALAAAREADALIEKIPEPGSNSIPIPEKKEEGLLSMFKRVFKGERNG